MKRFKQAVGVVMAVFLLAMAPARAQPTEFALSSAGVSGLVGDTVSLPFLLNFNLTESFTLLGMIFSFTTGAPLSFPTAPLISTDPVLQDFPGGSGIDFSLGPQLSTYSWIAPIVPPSFGATDTLTFYLPVLIGSGAQSDQSYSVGMFLNSLSVQFDESQAFYDPEPGLETTGNVRVLPSQTPVSEPPVLALVSLSCLALAGAVRRRSHGASALRPS